MSRLAAWHMLLRSLTLRPLARRPLRFVVTVIGVAAGVAAVVATVSSSRAAVHAFAEGVEEIAGRTRLEIGAPGGVPEEILGRLGGVAVDAVVAPVVDQVALAPALGDVIRLLGVDLLVDAELRPAVEAAAVDPAALEALLVGRGAVVFSGLADRLGLAPGDSLELVVDSRPARLEVVAVLEPPPRATAWDRMVVVDVALAQELAGRAGRLDRIELLPRAGVSVEALTAAVREVLPAGVDVQPPSGRRQAAEQMVSSLRFNLTALSAISVLVAAVLVATTLATSVVERRETLSVLRSLGASRLQIAAAVVTEAAVVGLAGGVLGAVGGWLGARAAADSARATAAAVLRAVPASEIRFDGELTLAAVILAVGIAVLAAALPVEEAVRTPPAQLLRALVRPRLGPAQLLRSTLLVAALLAATALLVRLPAWRGLPLAALLAALLILIALLAAVGPLVDLLARAGRPGLTRLAGQVSALAAASLSAERRRAAWAAGAVGVALALAVAIATLVASFRSTVVAWTETGMRSDVWIRPPVAATGMPVGRLDPELVEIALELFGPAAVDPFHSLEITVEGRPVALAGAAFDVLRRRGGAPFPGRESAAVFDEALRTHAAVVNEPFARRFGVGVGDTITLPLPGGPLERRVAGVFSDYSRSHGFVVIDRADFLMRFPDLPPTEIALFLPDGADPAAARDLLMEAARGRFLIEALLRDELKAEVLAAFDRTFAITTALYLVAAVVALVAVATVMATLVGERARDLAVLRVVGASRAQLLGVVLGEAALLGLTASAAGAAAGLAVGVILVKVVNLQSFGWSLDLVLPWASLARVGAGVVAACVLAAAGPALRAAAIVPAAALREEG